MKMAKKLLVALMLVPLAACRYHGDGILKEGNYDGGLVIKRGSSAGEFIIKTSTERSSAVVKQSGKSRRCQVASHPWQFR